MSELFIMDGNNSQVHTIDHLTGQLLRSSPANIIPAVAVYGQVGTDGRIFYAYGDLYEISANLQSQTTIPFLVPTGHPFQAPFSAAIYEKENLMGVSSFTLSNDFENYHNIAWNIEPDGIDSDFLSQWTTLIFNNFVENADESSVEFMATWENYLYYTTEAAVVRQVDYNTGQVNNIIYLNEDPLYQEYTTGKRDVDLQGVAISKVRNNLYAFGYDQQTSNNAYVYKAPLGTTSQWSELFAFQSDYFSESFRGTAAIIEPYLYMAPNGNKLVLDPTNSFFLTYASISRLNLDTLEFIEEFYKIQSARDLYMSIFGFADGTWNPSSGWHVGYIT